MNKYLGDWKCREDLENDFKAKIRDDVNVIVACYDLGHYSGQAIVLYKQNDKLFLVTASHCSCYGLEGQWNGGKYGFDLEYEIDDDFLRHRVKNKIWMWDDEKHNEEISKIVEEYLG